MQAILKTSTAHKHSTTNILPIVGEVNFSDEGKIFVEVKDEEELELLLKAIPDLSIFVENEELESQVETNDIGKASDEENDIGVSNDGDGEALDNSSLLESKTVLQLRELARGAGFTSSDYITLTKQALIDYLKAKLEKTA